MKRVLFRPQAARDLERLPNRDRDQVEEAIERFVQTGSGDIKMLAGEGRQLRLRVGDWRVRFVYEKPDIIRILHIATAAKHTVETATRRATVHPGEGGVSIRARRFRLPPGHFCPTLGRVRGNEFVRRIQALGKRRNVDVRWLAWRQGQSRTALLRIEQNHGAQPEG